MVLKIHFITNSVPTVWPSLLTYSFYEPHLGLEKAFICIYLFAAATAVAGARSLWSNNVLSLLTLCNLGWNMRHSLGSISKAVIFRLQLSSRPIYRNDSAVVGIIFSWNWILTCLNRNLTHIFRQECCLYFNCGICKRILQVHEFI